MEKVKKSKTRKEYNMHGKENILTEDEIKGGRIEVQTPHLKY
jgi:hypothetical protein